MLKLKRSPWAMFAEFTGRHRRLSLGLVIGMVVIGAGVITAAYFLRPEPATHALQSNVTNNAPAPNTTAYSPLTGKKVADQAATKRQVTAIIIENSPAARPQSGLKDSGVVFEAIAEGGITRFLVLYQEDQPNLIGPVRSLRPYYIDWLAPFDAAVGHVGGSANALGEIRNGSFKDIDQFFNGQFYWRATDRYAPHNVYTSFEKLNQLYQERGFTSSTFTGFPRKLDSPAAAPTAAAIQVDVSSPTYNSSYTYDKASNSYLRSEGGAPHMDREAGQINPKSVVVMRVPSHIGFEDGYREQMDTLGHNQAYMFQDGTVTEGFWRKDNQKAQIKFYDQAGNPIAFNAGQTWITVVSPDRSVTWQ